MPIRHTKTLIVKRIILIPTKVTEIQFPLISQNPRSKNFAFLKENWINLEVGGNDPPPPQSIRVEYVYKEFVLLLKPYYLKKDV